MLRVEQGGIHHQAAAAVVVIFVHNGKRKRIAHITVYNLAENIGAFIAVKGIAQHLQMQVQLTQRPIFLQMRLGRTQNIGNITRFIHKRHLPIKMAQNFFQAASQALRIGVKRFKRMRLGIDVFGGNCRFHKNKLIVVIFFVQ